MLEDFSGVGQIGLGIFNRLEIVRQPKLLHPGLAGNLCRLRKVHMAMIDCQLLLLGNARQTELAGISQRVREKRPRLRARRHQILAHHIGPAHPALIQRKRFPQSAFGFRISVRKDFPLCSGPYAAQMIGLCQQQQVFRADRLIEHAHKRFFMGAPRASWFGCMCSAVIFSAYLVSFTSLVSRPRKR